MSDCEFPAAALTPLRFYFEDGEWHRSLTYLSGARRNIAAKSAAKNGTTEADTAPLLLMRNQSIRSERITYHFLL
ncbi:hypothetical protein PANT111_200124 [Pantoea brenneri]|uniref:Uncharacterized protein n=1 Tax=Pantoea brenneri TaxID=472694 RepID=A0AAX3J793_9GAMM|nr:hypothetical protein PANT111_200124 [Pantoea brenneri]